MKVSYKKLWVMLAEREISKATLRKQAGLSSATFTKQKKNQGHFRYKFFLSLLKTDA